MEYKDIIKRLKGLSDPEAVKGMSRFGINPANCYGISIPALRKTAKESGRDHMLAKQLWDSGIHEARILATMVEEPGSVTPEQMDSWIKDFDSWDVCDQCCLNLFQKIPFAWDKAVEWSSREREFEKRAGFALMACLAWSDKNSPDDRFVDLLPVIKREAGDDRNFVKKAVNWALRNIGKRNMILNAKAIETAMSIREMDSRSAKWIASDALRELSGEAVRERLRKKMRPA
jgi:3-methyladenine DNA glycosylase AlkD